MLFCYHLIRAGKIIWYDIFPDLWTNDYTSSLDKEPILSSANCERQN